MVMDNFTASMVTGGYDLMLTNGTATPCTPHEHLMKTWFHFGPLSLARVLVTWFLFVLSMVGNSFVIFSLHRRKAHQFIMFHLAISNIVYSLTVMPVDAIWNTTMSWMVGDAGCRICQMMKQFGMYASSFMMVVIPLDRVTAILCSMPVDKQKKRGVVMVIIAWCASALCCIPAGVLFQLADIQTCEGITLYQCVDFLVVEDRHDRAGYYFFTMFISFILPFLANIVSYSLIVCEISNMKQRERVLMGRRNSSISGGMRKAKRKTVIMRTLITVSFLVCWGPYYVRGIYDWFQPEHSHSPAAAETVMYVAMYLSPVLHPLVFGTFMKEIRDTFKSFLFGVRDVIKGKRRISSTPAHSFNTSVTANTNVQFHSRASCKVTFKQETPDDPLKMKLIKQLDQNGLINSTL